MRNILTIFFASFLFFILVCLFSNTAFAQDRRISNNGYCGCTEKEYYKKLVGYAVDKDDEAFKKALTAGILTGKCTVFKKGEIVYLTDTSVFSGLIKIRRRGDVIDYWTAIEATK